MTSLKGKKVLLGVSGSIAAYKSAFLIRLLVKSEAEVRVIITASASDFIPPLTLATLSKNPVLSSFTYGDKGEWNNHVELGLWADLMLVAPASAHTLSKCANGICSDLLTAIYLSARCPVWFAPAMDLDMYAHPSTRDNLRKLEEYGNRIVEAREGELASGLSGQGRMAEPEELVEELSRFFENDLDSNVGGLAGKNVMVTAGPTYEAIDPVRFVGNHSTGKMGYAIARALCAAGANVTLISGPTALDIPPGVRGIKVTSAMEMHRESLNVFSETDIAVFSAAVSDFRPKNPKGQKIKKEPGVEDISVEMVKNPDIAAELGALKKAGQFTVGFALETHDEEQNAGRKLENKNLDMIVLNSLNEKGAGFGHDTNRVKFIFRNGERMAFELKSKDEVARDIVSAIIRQTHV
ncbi:bifunctional phosphopantothenoylcysteine decarboxylase/phosphopantothenate--cysteine ligase CoaBC [Roseivirga sp. BDSF3-8]|uniref:bifunctional phosphopantothenoylcysteine decarboxylase/phosphopantothenate--cysteine ligase CoaBC n=1 Tax=Roseivirga sp. BDSF3-8 TaxID=3241598 RepID=UPI003532660E